MRQDGNGNNNHFWTGIAIGGGVGGIAGGLIGYFWGRKQMKKKAVEEIKKVRKSAYDKGLYEGVEESKQWLANNPDAAQAILERMKNEASQEAPEAHVTDENPEERIPDQEKPEAVKEALEGQTEAFHEVRKEDEKADAPTVNQHVPSDMVEFTLRNGEKVLYPKMLFFDVKGNSLGEVRVRENLKYYEYDMGRLKEIWMALGWGEYIPDPDETVTDDYDGAEMGDEPRIKTEERERFLDLIDKYQAHPEEAPAIISQKSFDDECYLEKLYFDYYDGDNVFIENSDMDEPVDAMTMFGVSDGNELFRKKPMFDNDDDDNDPDIVHIRNFKMNAVAEITRYHCTYKSVKDGSAYIHGGTAQYGGTAGM